MIGGTDIRIRTRAGTDGLDVALRLVKRIWPEAIIEDALTGERQENPADLALDRSPELLVYRDAHAAGLWDECGAILELNSTLIHLLLAPDVLTVTLDNAPSERLLGYVEAIRDALAHGVFKVTVIRTTAA